MEQSSRWPAAQSSFVGRETELARLESLFAEGQRLVTVWGPAGVGKTRLALRHAESRADACFCALESARDLEAVCAILAETLETSIAVGAGSSSPVQAIGRALEARGRMLLVLDNFEQLAAHAPATVGRWLSGAPELRLLVTSRERLRIAGEAPLELAPLSLPADDRDASASDAVKLFVARAREIQQDFALTPATTPRVAALVAELEGLPLAIELAAARMGVLGLDGLLGRLTQRLDLLGRGRRDAEPRQATLRGAIEWSYELLGPEERRAFAQASVFRGGFSLPAAEAVLAIGDGTPVLDLLQSLRDKSLLVPIRAGAGDPRARSIDPSDVRFGMYESVRELAGEKLALLGDEGATLARHTAHYTAAARGWTSDPGATPRRHGLRQLAIEYENVLSVVRRCLDQPPVDAAAASSALEILVALDAVVSARGPLGGHAELLDRALTAAEKAEAPARLRGAALEARGRAEQVMGELAKSVVTFEAALETARAAGDRGLEATVLADLGVHHHQLREVERARDFYEQALAIDRETSDLRAEGRVLGNLAALEHDTRRLEAAAAGYRAALEIFRRVGDARLEGIHQTNLGLLEQERGRTDEAQACYQRALTTLREVGDRRLVGITLGNLGSLHHATGNLDEARASLERALITIRGFGDLRTEGLCGARLGAVLAALGRCDEARTELRAAELALERIGDRVALDAARTCAGFLDVALAEGARAAGRDAEAGGHIRAARARISAALAPGPDGGASAAELSDDVRLTIRLLERALHDAEATLAPDARGADALVIGPDAAWFVPPGGVRQDLATRASMRRILLLLAQQRERSPGVGVSLDELREAGWPGEAMAVQAAANRLHVALAHLRRSGLKPHLVRKGEGYLLAPTLPIRWAGA